MSNSCVFGLLVLFVSLVAADDPPPFKITTKRNNDRLDVKVEKDQTIFSVHSPFGISHAVVERTSEKWPDAVVLRLHLKGLENFKITSEKVKLEGSASLQHGKPVMRLWKDGKEDVLLDAKSSYWIDLRIFEAGGEPANELPLKDGYFELRLPKASHRAEPQDDHGQLDRLLSELKRRR